MANKPLAILVQIDNDTIIVQAKGKEAKGYEDKLRKKFNAEQTTLEAIVKDQSSKLTPIRTYSDSDRGDNFHFKYRDKDTQTPYFCAFCIREATDPEIAVIFDTINDRVNIALSRHLDLKACLNTIVDSSAVMPKPATKKAELTQPLLEQPKLVPSPTRISGSSVCCLTLFLVCCNSGCCCSKCCKGKNSEQKKDNQNDNNDVGSYQPPQQQMQ